MSSPNVDTEHAEAIELVATWLALAGIGGRAAMNELRASEFMYLQSTAGDHEEPRATEDGARAVRVCGDVDLHVLDDGYQVEMFVQVVRRDDTLAWGRRRLRFHSSSGRLEITSERFMVEGEGPLPEGPRPRAFSGIDCGPVAHTARDCIVVFDEGEPSRRLRYPARRSRPANDSVSRP